MSSTTILLLVLLATLVVSIGIAAVIVRAGRAQAQDALESLGTPLRSMAATGLGRTAEGSEPLTGTGTLVLTAEAVGFAQWRPARLLRIPRSDITRTDTTRSHLGKEMKEDVLRITWQGGAEPEESVAFFVRDIEPWLTDLGGQRTDP